MKEIKSISSTFLLGLLITACNFSKSVSRDLMTGLFTKGDGLSASEVHITDGDNTLNDNTFFYGQTIYTEFKGMKGFHMENDEFFPEMAVVVISKDGDTLLANDKLLGGKGMAMKKNNLIGNITLATPIQSGKEYTARYTITDTKGKGVFFSELDFELIKDPIVQIKENGLTINEAYLFSDDKNKVIKDAQVYFNEALLFDVQGLDGYAKPIGAPRLGFSVLVKDADGLVIYQEPDLLENEFISEEIIKQGLASTLKIKKGKLKNPIDWSIKIWDKTTGASVVASALIEVK